MPLAIKNDSRTQEVLAPSDDELGSILNKLATELTPTLKINPHQHLKDIIKEMYEGDLFDHPMANLIERIVNDKGSFGKECRIELFQGCFIQQKVDFDNLTPENIPELMIKHLGLTNQILTQGNISEMHDAVRNGWVKLMNRNLNLLFLAEQWTEQHTEYLTLTLDVLKKVSFPNTEECEVLPERLSEIIHSVGRFLSKPPECLFSDPQEPLYAEALYALIEIASLLKSPGYAAAFEDLYWNVNRICHEFSPLIYGIEDDEQEYIEDENIGTLVVEQEENYEIISSDSLTTEDLEEAGSELYYAAVEAWKVVHDSILKAIYKIPNKDIYFDFWIDVLENDSLFAGSSKIALEGLAVCTPQIINNFLPKLAELAIEDPMAVIRLIEFMPLSEIIGDSCLSDTKEITINTIKELDRKLQREILNSAKELVHDRCDMIEDMEMFKSSLEDLAAGLKFKLRFK